MKSFEHSQTRELTEADYASIHSISSRRSRPWRLLLLFAASVACLFWSYTLLLGIVLLGVGALAIGAPRLLPGSMSAAFRDHAHLHQPLTFGVSDQGLSVSARHLDFRCGWPNLAVWHERDGWLRVSPHGMQDLYFRVSELQEASVYERVIELCRKHGREYNAKRRAA